MHGPRPDERHLAPEHVEELRQLVEARLPQPASDARHRLRPLELVQPSTPSVPRPVHDRRQVLPVLLVVLRIVIVRNLSAVNSRMCLPEPGLPEEDRARASRRLIRNAMLARTAGASARAGALTTKVDRALDDLARPGHRTGRRPSSGSPSTEWTSTLRAARPRRAAARCRSGRRAPQLAHELRAASASGVSVNATTTRSTFSRCTTSTRSSSRQIGSAPSSGAALSRLSSTRPTSRMPYSGCWTYLRRDQLADLARADDHGVLDVRGAAPDEASPDDASACDEDDREQPERNRLVDLRRGDPVAQAPAKRTQTPTVTRWKTSDHVVGRRMIGPFLVAVVEPVEPRGEHPERQADRRRATNDLTTPEPKPPPLPDGPAPSRRRRRSSRRRRRAAARAGPACPRRRPCPAACQALRTAGCDCTRAGRTSHRKCTLQSLTRYARGLRAIAVG